jgi:hypothetical protein
VRQRSFPSPKKSLLKKRPQPIVDDAVAEVAAVEVAGLVVASWFSPRLATTASSSADRFFWGISWLIAGKANAPKANANPTDLKLRIIVQNLYPTLPVLPSLRKNTANRSPNFYKAARATAAFQNPANYSARLIKGLV